MTRAGLGAVGRGVTHASGLRRLTAMRPELCRGKVRRGPNVAATLREGGNYTQWRSSVARLCERTVGRRVPPLWAGLVSFASPTEPRWVHHRCDAAALRKAALFFVAGVGAGGALRWLATARSRELCEALETE